MRQVEKIHRDTLTKTDYLIKDNSLGDLQPTRAATAIRDLLYKQKEYIVATVPAKDVK